MKILIRFISIIGLVSMSQAAIAIDNVSDGDVLTADTMNEIIDATNANSGGFDFDITNPCNGGTRYSVGDTGPAGGLVFITDSAGCNGLEAWTADESTASWGCASTEVGTDVMVGSGAPNTAKIIAAGCTGGGDAADLTRLRDEGGEDDWYLPSLGELLVMYDTIGPGGTNTGGFDETASYWTSSEVFTETVWIVNFSDRLIRVRLKSSPAVSRAIRTFNQP